MAELISLIVTIIILLWKIFNGNYGIGGEIFIPVIVPLLRFYWEVEKDICPYDPDEEEFED